MERYDNVFAELKSRQEGAFVPFVILGDPGPEQSLKIIDTLIECDAARVCFGRDANPVLRNAGGDPSEAPHYPDWPADVRQPRVQPRYR